MAKTCKFTKAEVRQALVDAKGSRVGAADILGCDNVTVWRYMKRFPDLEAEVKQMDEEVTQIAKDRLVDMVVEGNNLGALIFWLKARANWSEKQQVEHSGETKTTVVYEPPPRPASKAAWLKSRREVVQEALADE